MVDPQQVAREADIEPHKSCAWRLIAILTWVMLVLIMVVIGFRYWYQSRFDATQKAELNRLSTEIVELPANWQVPAIVPSDDVLDFFKVLHGKMHAMRTHYPVRDYYDPSTTTLIDKLITKAALTTTETQQLDDLESEITPFAESAAAMVLRPDYTTEVDLYSAPSSTVGNLGVYCDAAALWSLNNGDTSTALDLAVLPLRLYRQTANVSFYTRIVPRSQMVVHLPVWAAIARDCQTTEALHRGLELLNSVSDQVRPRNLDYWIVADSANALAQMQAAGYKIDYGPRALGDMLVNPQLALESESFGNWLLENLPAGDRRLNYARQMVGIAKGTKHSRGTSYKRRLNRMLLDMNSHVFSLLTGYDQASVRALDWGSYRQLQLRLNVVKSVTALYELARLRFAQRLAEIEGGVSAPQGPEAVLPYIDTIPEDPFSSGPMCFSVRDNRFYSIGNDGVDDQLTTRSSWEEYSYGEGDLVLGF